MNKPNAPVEGSELPAMGLLEAAQALVEAMGTCHICKGLLILQEYAVHCEDCSYYCENHDGPECVPIYELHRRLKAALSSPQQESAEFTEAKKLLIEAREMRNLFVRADQNHGSKSADTMSEKADEIFYRILEFNKRVAPPVTVEGDRG